MNLSRHPAVFSLVALVTSLLVLFYTDDKNDKELIREQTRIDTNIVRAQCVVGNDRNDVIVSAFFRLAEAVPGESQEELDFLDYIIACLPQRDCEQPLVVPERPDYCDAVTAREPASG